MASPPERLSIPVLTWRPDLWRHGALLAFAVIAVLFAWRAPGFTWLPTNPPLHFTISWVTLEERQPSRAARAFLRTFQQVLEENRAKP